MENTIIINDQRDIKNYAINELITNKKKTVISKNKF